MGMLKSTMAIILIILMRRQNKQLWLKIVTLRQKSSQANKLASKNFDTKNKSNENLKRERCSVQFIMQKYKLNSLKKESKKSIPICPIQKLLQTLINWGHYNNSFL